MILSPREIKLVLRTLLRPSDSIRPMDVRFCSVVRAHSPQSATRLEQNTARLDNEDTCGRLNRLTAHYFGYWSLAMGLVMRLCRYLCLYALRPTLYTKSDSDHASNLSPYRLIVHHLYALISLPASQAVFWRRCHRQMQERYEVARVKTDGQFGRTS